MPYERDDEELSYPHLREMLGPAFRDVSPERIEALFEHTDISALDAENFFRGVGRAFSTAGRAVARALPQVARVAAPIAQAALPIVGGAIGGPLGGALGGLAGQAVGALAQPAGQRQAALRPRPTMTQPAGAPPGTAALTTGGSGAAAQLMQLLSDPRVLQALGGLALGNGRNVGVGGQRVPPAAFTNLIGALANQASADAMVMEGPTTFADYAERATDPASVESRAAALLELLQETEVGWRSQSWMEPVDATEQSDEDLDEGFEWTPIEVYEEYYESFFADEPEPALDIR